MLACKCPRCRKGNIFQSSLANFWANRKINSHCTVCHQRLEPEPGFFFGAMYVSYGFSVAIALITGFVLYNFFNDPDLIVYFLTVLITVLALTPFMYRYSRSIFLHLFGGINFDPNYQQ